VPLTRHRPIFKMGLIPFLHTSFPAARCAATRTGGELCSPTPPPQSVTYAVSISVTHALSTKCYPCDEHVHGPALPSSRKQPNIPALSNRATKTETAIG